MGLVDYSDSEASDIEETPVVKTVPTSSKPAFHKVVDRSNPGKIRVSLPQAALKDESSDEPPTKRVKTGGGGAFSGFNSFLPAPKRAGQSSASLGGGNAVKKGLGAGVNLKTGAAPGFSRESAREDDTFEEEGGSSEQANGIKESEGPGMNIPPPRAVQPMEQKPAEDVKLVGKPLMFKPLSVSRKPTKKKKPIVAAEAGPSASTVPVTPETKAQKPSQRPKVSLFSMSAEPEQPSASTAGDYKPLYSNENDPGEDENDDSPPLEPSYEEYTPTTSNAPPPAVPTPPTASSLSSIASDLHLSASERRQLFGRQKGGSRSNQAAHVPNIINFNTDQEYLHNEELRAAGEQVVHNPVRAIAPGKHSLKQLVNAAQSQKEALEESFAKGKSNRAEASSRYGW